MSALIANHTSQKKAQNASFKVAKRWLMKNAKSVKMGMWWIKEDANKYKKNVIIGRTENANSVMLVTKQ